SDDGYRILFDTGNGFDIQDFGANTIYSISTQLFDGLTPAQRLINPSWTRMLVVYNNSPTGQYYPGNALAVYQQDGSLSWLIAGDDLPPVGSRQYGWKDDNTVYVYGQGRASDAPARIYGVDYAANGLPTCLSSAFPDQSETLLPLWNALQYYLRPDALNQTAQRVCASLPTSLNAVEGELSLTQTPILSTALPAGDAPDCLLERYPSEVDQYNAIWKNMVANLNAEQRSDLASMLCDSIGTVTPPQSFDASYGVIMFIDATTGVRSSGDFPATPAPRMNPVDALAPLFKQAFQRPMGNAILSKDQQLLAVSNLPGELTIYRLGFPYAQAVFPITQTAQALATAQNLIYALPSPSPTPNVIGTARPTLTPTPIQTLIPRPEPGINPTNPASEQMCPLDPMYDVKNLPPGYSATGRIYMSIGDVPVWAVEAATGERFQDPDAPQCGNGLNCQFSPDRAWILAQTNDLVYITRPDNSDQRILWDLRTPFPATPFPSNLRWSGRDTLEWDTRVILPNSHQSERGVARDVLNVYPDPDVWIPQVEIDSIPGKVVGRQPGGFWAVVSIPYRTGSGDGYGTKYYLYQSETNEYVLFAQDPNNSVSFSWSPFGDHLYFSFPHQPVDDRYEIVFPSMTAERARTDESGDWSPDGGWIARWTGQQLQAVNTATGDQRVFCVPVGQFKKLVWSPDSRYIALQMKLTSDDKQHLLVVDINSGNIVNLTTDIYMLITWGQEPGTYLSGAAQTPTPVPTGTQP
ncbi:MAG TPA: hypothetical protein VHD90_11135, partial [Phototrophicaceae bacterium]|nr:hypothetical protein [Phototrophicaceae bacterium]